MTQITEAVQHTSRTITDARLLAIRNAYQGLKERSVRSYAPEPVIDRADEMVTLCDELIVLRRRVNFLSDPNRLPPANYTVFK